MLPPHPAPLAARDRKTRPRLSAAARTRDTHNSSHPNNRQAGLRVRGSNARPSASLRRAPARPPCVRCRLPMQTYTMGTGDAFDEGQLGVVPRVIRCAAHAAAAAAAAGPALCQARVCHGRSSAARQAAARPLHHSVCAGGVGWGGSGVGSVRPAASSPQQRRGPLARALCPAGTCLTASSGATRWRPSASGASSWRSTTRRSRI